MSPEERYSRVILITALSALVFWLVVGTVGFHILEEWTWIQSFYFSVATLTTVGYGDIHPTHDLSRLFAALYILAGVTTAITCISIIGNSYINHRKGWLHNLQDKAADFIDHHHSD